MEPNYRKSKKKNSEALFQEKKNLRGTLLGKIFLEALPREKNLKILAELYGRGSGKKQIYFEKNL